MKLKALLTVTVTIILMIGIAARVIASSGREYVGAERCMECHQEQYSQWERTGHAQILRRPSQSGAEAIPLPDGYDANSISYIIGGFRWKALFLDRNGFLVTSTSVGSGGNQYNLRSTKWVDFRPGERVPYDCGRCHTTGYSPEGHQAGLEGITGTWRFEGVQCEACHGPGQKHMRSSDKADISVDGNVCSKCHGIEPYDVITLNGVFLSGYTEVNQLVSGGKSDFTCVDCHDPHLPSQESIKVSCAACHEEVAEVYKESLMHRVGVTCTDCHMPPAGMIASGNSDRFHGDVKSHLFRIDHRKNLTSVVKDGLQVNPGYLSVDYACMRCHHVYEDRQWAASYSTHSHEIKITTNVRIKQFQMVFASVGLLFALVSLLSALSLKNWLFPTVDKKRMVGIHKHSAWITLYLYVFLAAMCIYFHLPLGTRPRIFHLGWFTIHPIGGTVGILIYAGKILTVRMLKKGWQKPGLFWGIMLFVFWSVQFATAVL